MNKIFADILNQVNEGILIVDETFQILFWNSFMEQITGISRNEALHRDLFEVLPGLKRNYVVASLHQALENDYKPFFAAGMHRGLITDKAEINVKISSCKSNDFRLLVLECIDVTSQYLRVNQLKEYVKKLSELNRELREKEKEIARLAYYDELTGLTSRALFFNLAQKFLHNARREQSKLAFMFIDLDNFKCINDSFGHQVGDQVLKELARVLTGSVRANDIVARYGGDEFVVLLPGLDEEHFEQMINRLRAAVTPVQIDNLSIKVSLSIGISFFPEDGNTVDELITRADKAMYQAKSAGGNLCFPYNRQMDTGRGCPDMLIEKKTNWDCLKNS